MIESDDVSEVPQTEQAETPAYLLTTNRLFNIMVQNISAKVDSIALDDIQDIARSMHHLGVLHLQKTIFTTYLHAVKGTLKEPECDLIDVDRRILPIYMKRFMEEKRKSTALPDSSISASTSTTTTMESDTDDEYLTYENFVYKNMDEADQQIELYQKRLNEKKKSLKEFSSEIEGTIQSFVEQRSMKLLKAQNDLRITIINHEFDAEILKRKYLQENPNEYQVKTDRWILWMSRNRFYLSSIRSFRYRWLSVYRMLKMN